MGWSSGSEIFDPAVSQILKLDVPDKDKVKVILALAEALVDADWDTVQESDYWEDPLVRKAFKKIFPDWDWKEIEENE